MGYVSLTSHPLAISLSCDEHWGQTIQFIITKQVCIQRIAIDSVITMQHILQFIILPVRDSWWRWWSGQISSCGCWHGDCHYQIPATGINSLDSGSSHPVTNNQSRMPKPINISKFNLLRRVVIWVFCLKINIKQTSRILYVFLML